MKAPHADRDRSARDLEPCTRLDPGSRVLLHHDHEGGTQPLVWVTERAGARLVYDALGHDVGSYASPARVELLQREVRWLLGQVDPAG